MVAELALPVLPLDTILHGDCLEVLRSLPDNSVDAIVTDPPYGLGTPPDMVDVLRAWLAGEAYTPRGRGFMGKAWDAFVPGPEYWRECLRVLKPGGHALVFAGTRTWDVMGLALRLAGFELRDTLQWLYGSGFPKSLDVGKAIDKAAGAQREVVGIRRDGVGNTDTSLHKREGFARSRSTVFAETRAATDAARAWDGWGTALKPAWEPVILCRKPLSESNIAANVLRWGTGALNIGASRVESGRDYHDLTVTQGINTARTSWEHRRQPRTFAPASGRWPANLLLSHSLWCDETACALDCPVRALDAQSGVLHARGNTTPTKRRQSNGSWGMNGATIGIGPDGPIDAGDTGGASRYFTTFRYTAKASRSERNRGCSSLDAVERSNGNKWTDQDYRVARGERTPGRESGPRQNHHPTVKPLALMSWLIGLITPPGGLVLDPFAGSGSTLVAAKQGGWRFIGIEREREYVAIAEARLSAPSTPVAAPAKPKRTRAKKQPQPTLLEVSA